MSTKTIAERAREVAIEYLEDQYGGYREDWLENLSKRIAVAITEAVREEHEALRKVNDLQHRMAIELQNIPSFPRIDYWTRQIEKVICDALARGEGSRNA